VLRELQQLTYLELNSIRLKGPDQASPALQALQALTWLADLRIHSLDGDEDNMISVIASVLSGTHHLTRLQLVDCTVDPAVLAGKTLLRTPAVVRFETRR
jgi:hypothetical protein